MVTYLEYTTLNDFRKGTFRTVWGGKTMLVVIV